MSDEASGSALPGKDRHVPSHPGRGEVEKRDCQPQRRHAGRGLCCILARLVALASAVLWIVDGQAAPALPGEPCQTDPRVTWSETEQWIWNQVCIGEIADLNEHLDPGGPALDPRSLEGWTEERKLSAGFLETILLHDPWRSAIPRRGVRIIGAWFDEPLDLVEAEIAHEVVLDKSRLASNVHFNRVRTKSLISLDGAAVTGTLVMDAADIGGSLFMQGAEFSEIILRAAKIEGQLNLIGAKVTGTLHIDSASIDGSLLMREGAEFAQVDLRGAKIGGQLDMTGAKVTDKLTMESASIGGELYMREGAEFAQVDLRGAKIGGQLEMTGARVTGTLEMHRTSIGGHLFMNKGAEFAEVNLRSAKIGGQLVMTGAKVTGTLDMHLASIGSGLLMHEGAEFTDVDLSGVKIGGQLDMIGAKVTGTLNMQSASIGSHLVIKEGAEFAEMELRGAKIGGRFSVFDARITDTLKMEGASIGSDFFMDGAQFSEPIDLIFARIGGNLDLQDGAVAGLDLTGARVEGALRLTSPEWRATGADGAMLVLVNTRVGAVQAEREAWPMRLDLDGFTYDRFGGLGEDPEAAVGVRGSEWFVDWLARDEPYSPQPYEQLAKVLREMGHPEMATDVLYAGRERERKEAWQRGEKLRWLGLSMLNWTIGYGHGHRFFWALYWVVGLVLIGTVVLGVTGQNQRDDGRMIGIWYSLDMLLPIIQLRKEHYDIDLEGFARYWFYGHKLMGYVLASFLIAGLAGLTK